MTTVPAGYPGTAYRPRPKPQNPRINGYWLGWKSCTAYAFAVFAERATLGRLRLSGEEVREAIVPADHTGGTNLEQMDQVARHFGVPFFPRIGSNYARPAEIARWLYEGRPVELQGWTSPFLSTPWRTTAGGVNHAITLTEGRGWHHNAAGVLVPSEVLEFDPAGDGLQHSFGEADLSPSWIPFSLAMRFAARLNVGPIVSGQQTYVPLGAGRAYAAYGPDTEPHVLLRHGAVRPTPFPDRTRADPPPGMNVVYVRSRPDRINSADVVGRLDDGELFVSWGVTSSGVSVAGSRKWRQNQDGTRWVPEARLRREGGST